MQKTAKKNVKKRPLTVAAARRSARLVMAKRGNRPFPVTAEFRERVLGHFGPPVKRASSKKRSTAKTSSKKRSA